MEEVVLNELTHEGMRHVKLLGDEPFETERPVAMLLRNGVIVPEVAMKRLQVEGQCDAALGLHSLEVRWPVFGPVDVLYFGPKRFRRFVFVHYSYAERVSECLSQAVEIFLMGCHFLPGFAFVRKLPAGTPDCMEIDYVTLVQAEWMPEHCVAIGGRAD